MPAMPTVRSERNQNDGFYIAPTLGSYSATASIADSLFASNGGNGIWADSLGGAFTYIRLARSVVSDNGQSGFYATSAAAISGVYVTLVANSFDNPGGRPGARLLGTAPGTIQTFASDNVFSIESYMAVDGSGNTHAYLTGNGGGYLYCVNGATLYSFANNNFSGMTAVTGCTVNKVTGY